MNIVLRTNGYDNHAQLLEKHIKRRIPTQIGNEGLVLELKIDAGIGAPESYEILPALGGYQIVGADSLGLYYGIGKLLHSAKWSDADFVPNPPKGVVTPACSFRAKIGRAHV